MISRAHHRRRRSSLPLACAALLVAAAASSAQTTQEIHEMMPPGGPGSPVLPAGTLPINYHVLHNGVDIAYSGIGAGGQQTAMDGIGTWIPGEDVRGGLVGPNGGCPYRMTAWRETVCVDPTATTIEFPLIIWAESNGAVNTAHDPKLFPKMEDPQCAGYPLNGGNPFVPFGGTSGIDFATGPSPIPGTTGDILVPNAGGLSYNVILGIKNLSLAVPAGGGCWVVQFELVNAPVESIDLTPNGWWHWARNAPSLDQHWGFSNDELNLWKSRTVASDNNLSAIIPFLANVEYGMQMATADPNTHLATLPAGFNMAGAYSAQTENIIDGKTGGPAFNPNMGFDLGGHGTLSLSGTVGVAGMLTGLAAQDPMNLGGISPGGGALMPTLGFWTFDAGPTGTGTKRVNWLRVDFDNLLLVDPALSPPVKMFGGTVCAPFTAFPTAAEVGLALFFAHETAPCPGGCPDPDGLPSGSFGVPAIQGGSIMVPLPPTAVCVPLFGLSLPMEYGSSGLKGPTGVTAPATGFTWNPAVAATSGIKTMYLID